MSSMIPFINPDSGELDIREFRWEMTEEEMSYMPIYQRAHALMPPPQSTFMDPDEYVDELGSAVEILRKADLDFTITTDDLLRSIAILGHTPYEESIRALSIFTRSNHSLAPVAGLALAECSGLFSVFRPAARAS